MLRYWNILSEDPSTAAANTVVQKIIKHFIHKYILKTLCISTNQVKKQGKINIIFEHSGISTQ
jgi:hypothetical protein